MERKSQVQIPKDLLLALFQYHLAGNEEYQPEIEKALMEKIRQYGKTSVVYNIQKQHQPRKNGKRQDKNIWISAECIKIFDGKGSA